MLALLVFSACSIPATIGEPKQTTSTTYEVKNLTASDVKKITFGDNLEKVYKELGKPEKEWNGESVYDQLRELMFRHDYEMVFLADDTFYAMDKYVMTPEQKAFSEKAYKTEKLRILQYTYSTDLKQNETFLCWIDLTTETVAYRIKHSYVDEDRQMPTQSLTQDSTDLKGERLHSHFFKVGEIAIFRSGLKVTLTSLGDTTDEPRGEINGHLVKVVFLIDNRSDEKITVSAMNFVLQDEKAILWRFILKIIFKEMFHRIQKLRLSSILIPHLKDHIR